MWTFSVSWPLWQCNGLRIQIDRVKELLSNFKFNSIQRMTFGIALNCHWHSCTKSTCCCCCAMQMGNKSVHLFMDKKRMAGNFNHHRHLTSNGGGHIKMVSYLLFCCLSLCGQYLLSIWKLYKWLIVVAEEWRAFVAACNRHSILCE